MLYAELLSLPLIKHYDRHETMNIKQLYEEGRYDEVVSLLNDTVEPDFIEVKGFALQKLGRWEEAMECWNQLVAMHPDHGDHYNNRGVCKFNLRFKHAIDDFNKAIELEPDNPYFYSSRAYVRDKIGDTEGSVADYKRAHELDPSDALVLNNLGLAEQKLGYTAQARERFRNSDDLLGIKTIDSISEPPSSPPRITFWGEVRKMLTTKEGFREFLRDIGLIRK